MIPEWTEFLRELNAAQRDGDVLALHMPLLGGIERGGDRPESARMALHPATERATARKPGAVAVIPVRGIITNRRTFMEMIGYATSTELLSRRIRAAVADPEVKAVILDIDSPGGTVPGVPELADEIFNLRGDKPIVAQVNAVAASAAYWIASATDQIAAPPASYTGSIGVFSIHVDETAALEAEGLKVSVMASTDDKVEDMPFLPLSDDARAYLQARVDEFDRMFTDAVARGRGMRPAAVRDMEGRGRVWPGARALERGLIDKVRTLQETLEAYGVPGERSREEARGRAAARRRRELDLIEQSAF